MSDGDYFPEGQRYGVMAIEGYTDMAISDDPRIRSCADYGFSFWVVDTEVCGREIAVFKARGHNVNLGRVARQRRRAIAHADLLNELEKIDRMKEAGLGAQR